MLATQGELSAGRIAEAQRLALEARATCAASQNRHAELAATLLYGHVCAWNGQLHQAAHIYQHVLQLAEHEDDPSDRAWALYGLAQTYSRQGMKREAQTVEKYFRRAWSGDRKRLDLARL